MRNMKAKKDWNKTDYLLHKDKYKARSKAYRLAHCEQIKTQKKAWVLAHPEQDKARKKAYYVIHLEQVRARTKTWRLVHLEQVSDYKKAHEAYAKTYRQTPEGKETMRKVNAKQYAQRKQFGFTTLNEYFDSSEGHHVDLKRVIYIPKEIHKSIWHSVTKNINMEVINNAAFEFMATQNI